MTNTSLKQKCVVWCVVVVVIVCGAGWLYELMKPADAPTFDIYNMDGISMIDDLIQKYEINNR